MSGLTPATTKQFNPIGGVIRQSSAILTTIIPNQNWMSSNAYAGNYRYMKRLAVTTGSVKSRMPMASINIPKTT